jgi:DNA polymerase III epsilon subunit-like protein
MKKNVFVMDLETNTKMPLTNANGHDSFINDPKCHEIIDRFVYEYNFDYCVSEGLIKNNYPLHTTHITGITYDDLRDAPSLDVFREEMKIIMTYCEQPIFIAHNGVRFDFEVMYYYGLLDKKGIVALDTLYLFRLFIPDMSVSNKLIDCYNYLFGSNVKQTHRAKGDTMLIVDILKKVNLTTDELVEMTKS